MVLQKGRDEKLRDRRQGWGVESRIGVQDGTFAVLVEVEVALRQPQTFGHHTMASQSEPEVLGL